MNANFNGGALCVNCGEHWETHPESCAASTGDKENPAHDIATVLQERGARYGAFSVQAITAQELKNVMVSKLGWRRLSEAQRESLELIATKISRILNGDPCWADSWDDIAGYAKLVADDVRKQRVLI